MSYISVMDVADGKWIPAEALERAADTLRVLAHPHRLRMVELLCSGDFTVGCLAEAVGVAPHACSQHLRLMESHGLLERRRAGKKIHYRVVHPNALTVIECIRKHV